MRIQNFDYSVTLDNALLWEYSSATSLQTIIEGKQNWYNLNQSQFWTNWYNDVFNLLTCNDFGLSVWSIILGLPLFLAGDSTIGQEIWGFGEYKKNFDHGNFTAANSNIVLTTEQQRLVLRLQYFKLTTRADALDINKFYAEVFQPLGQVYVLDGLNMNITYVFTFTPDTQLLNAIQTYDLLARPAGVGIKYVFEPRETWGFGEYKKNFNNGTFNG